MKGYIMKNILLFALMLLIPTTVVAGQIPDSIGNFKLGQKGLKRTTAKATFEGFKGGELKAYIDEKGVVDKIRFGALSCEGMDDTCLKKKESSFKKLTKKYTASLGKPLKTEKSNVTWESAGKRLEIKDDYTGGLGEELAIYIENIDETKPGGTNDGFAEFYSSFKQAVTNGDKEHVASMVKYPFEKQCGGEVIKNKSIFMREYSTLFSPQNIETIKDQPIFWHLDDERRYFSLGIVNGFGFKQKTGKWNLVGYYCSE
jgi:hypothetical protein